MWWNRSAWILALVVPVLLPFGAAGQSLAPQVLAHSAERDEALYADPQAVADGRGGLFVLWRRTASGSTQSSVVVQHLRADGEPAWAGDGVGVSPEGAHCDHPQLIADGLGGCIVAWEEHRGTRVRVLLQRLGADGQLSWPKRGLPASVSSARQLRPALATDYQGGAFVAWEEENAATERDIVVQRLTPSGAYVFKPLGIAVVAAGGVQQNVQLAATPSQGVIALWEDFRSGARWTLYAQQLTLDGRSLWPSGGVSLAPPRQITQRYPTVFGDGFGGLVCVYEALGGLNLDRDLYALRLNRAGNAVYHAPIAVRRADQTRPRVFKRGSDALVVWEDYRSGDADLYLQRFDLATGEMALAVDGVAVAQGPGDQLDPHLAPTSLIGEPVISWLERGRLRAQKVDNSGGALWGDSGRVVARQPAGERWAVTGNDRGGAWLAWIEASSGAPRAQGFTGEGMLRYAGQGRALIEATRALHIRMERPTAAAGLAGDGYIAWEDYRGGAKNPDIYLQRVDAHGRARWRQGGVRVCDAEGLQSVPVLCPVNGGVVVGWLDRRSNDDNLYLQFVDSTGRLRWRAEGLPLCVAPRSQSNLRLVSSNVGEVFACWTDARDFAVSGFDIYYQRVTLDGRMLLPQDGAAMATGASYQNSVSASGDGRGRVVAAWAEEDNGVYSIRAQLFVFGQPLWGPGRWVNPSAGQQRVPQVGLTASGAAWVCWSEERQAELGQIHLALLLPDGSTAWGAKRLSPSAAGQSDPQLRVLGSEALVGWQDARQAEASGLHRFAMRVRTDGVSPWGGSLDLGAFVPEGAASDVLSGDVRGVGLQPEGRTRPVTLALTRFDSAMGRVLARGGLRATAADQADPCLIALPGGRIAAVWLERQSQPPDARLLLMLLD